MRYLQYKLQFQIAAIWHQSITHDITMSLLSPVQQRQTTIHVDQFCTKANVTIAVTNDKDMSNFL